ncbi:MAG: hypothetical protein M3081_20640 [Gemmatimonadota bacterium]|nr:hypothetical protein [Gemmatimonadota bacterium]
MPDAEPHATDPVAQMIELQKATARLQHEINNPLAALLAEAQLLSLEPTLGDEHQKTVGRIIDLTRRVADSVRKFDELRGERTVDK